MFCSANREEIVSLLSAVTAQGTAPEKTRLHLAAPQEPEPGMGLLPERAPPALHPCPLVTLGHREQGMELS